MKAMLLMLAVTVTAMLAAVVWDLVTRNRPRRTPIQWEAMD